MICCQITQDPLMCFITFISAVLSALLSWYVFCHSKKVSERQDVIENHRHEDLLKIQRAMTLSQLRQNEIIRLNNVLQEALLPKSSLIGNVHESAMPMYTALISVDTFLKTKSYLFPVIENYKDVFLELHNQLLKMIQFYVEGKFITKDLTTNYINKKDELISELQKFCINELSN